jgi:hypothetical protein
MLGDNDDGNASCLIGEIAYFQNVLREYEEKLETVQRSCQHNWTKPKCKKVSVPYCVNGCVSSDPNQSYPGIFQYREVDTWYRECIECLKREETTAYRVSTTYSSKKEPIFDENSK